MNNIVLLIPSLNPDQKLVNTVETMVAAGFSNVLIVNDGSDKEHLWPFETIKTLDGVTVIGYEENKGKGYALKYGFRYILENFSDAAGVVTCDGDGQHLSTDCVKVAEALGERKEFIFGCRNFKDESVPLHNKLGNTISIFMYNFLCEIKLSDTQTGLRAIPTKYLSALIAVSGDRFEYETNMLIYMKANNLKYSEVPITTVYEEDSNKKSHFRVFEDSVKIYKPLLKFGGPRILKFAASSLLATVVDLTIFTVLNLLLTEHTDDFVNIVGGVFIATFIARICSSLFNYYFSKHIVFANCSKGSMGRYYIVAVCQLSVSAMLVSVISHLFSAVGILQTLVKCIVDIVLFFASYKIQREWVFK